MNILFVTNRPADPTLLTMFERESWNVYTEYDLEDALMHSKSIDYSLILVDYLPLQEATRFVRQVRENKIEIPIVVNGVQLASSRAALYQVGASIALVPQVAPGFTELRCAMYAASSAIRATVVLRSGGFVLNRALRHLEFEGSVIHITKKEYAMLEILMMREGNVVTKEAFLNHLYGGIDEPNLKIVDVFLCKLRKKMRACVSFDPIETVWGRGYRLKTEKEYTQEPINVLVPAPTGLVFS